jgi:hypothetical protein
MKLYKAYQFRDVQEIEVCSFTSTSISYSLSSKYPNNTGFKVKDRIITTERFGNRGNYFETPEEAKEFILNQLEKKVIKVELELLKYRKLLDNLKDK